MDFWKIYRYTRSKNIRNSGSSSFKRGCSTNSLDEFWIPAINIYDKSGASNQILAYSTHVCMIAGKFCNVFFEPRGSSELFDLIVEPLLSIGLSDF